MPVSKHIISGKDVMKQVKFEGGEKNKSQILAQIHKLEGFDTALFSLR